jgi:hypothetical protein
MPNIAIKDYDLKWTNHKQPQTNTQTQTIINHFLSLI